MEKFKLIEYVLSNKYYVCIIIGFLFLINTAIATNSLTDKNKFSPLLIEVKINDQLIPDIVQAYRDSQGKIWIKSSDLQAWRFSLPAHSPLLYHGHYYYQLDWYSHLRYAFDFSNMQLSIHAPVSIFTKTILNQAGFNPAPIRPSKIGSYLNYDIVSLKNANTTLVNNSLLTDLNLFTPVGVGNHNLLLTNYTNNTHAALYKLIRLTTTWTLDKPEEMTSWRFGDSITGSCIYCNATRFIGIQYATNFNTQPAYITFPLPGYQGEAIVPSNVDIFVNGIFNQRQFVKNGGYLVNNIPVITGSGIVSIVTQDLLGRTQIVSLPYYATPTLLKPGLSNFSYEIGLIRTHYGINSQDYGHALAVGTYQRGIREYLTLGSHTELMKDQQTIGGIVNYLFNQWAVLNLGISTSHTPHVGAGSLISTGLTRQTPTYTASIQTTYLSGNYQQLGIQAHTSNGKYYTQMFFGYNIQDWGSIGLSYTKSKVFALSTTQNTSIPTVADIITASYTKNIFKTGTMIASLAKDCHHSENNQFYLAFIFALDNEHVVNAFTNYQNNSNQPAVLFSKNLPLGKGYGYHLLATTRTSRGANGPGVDFSYQNEIGSYTGKIYQIAKKNTYEGDVNGSIIFLNRQFFLAKRVTNSFTLVHVPHYNHVRIYYQNQLMGRTQQDGYLVVPDLLAYQANKIDIDPRDLPLDVSIPTYSKLVKPYYHSGELTQFKVQKHRIVLISLILTNGKYIPAGSSAILDHVPNPYPIGYNGLLYLIDPPHPWLQGKIAWKDQTCFFKTFLPPLQGMVKLGRIVCHQAVHAA